MTQQNLAHAPEGTHPDSSEKTFRPTDALARVAVTGILPVVAIPSVEAAVPLADALVAGGVRSIEVTLRNPWAQEAVSAIRAVYPDKPFVAACDGSYRALQSSCLAEEPGKFAVHVVKKAA